MILRSIRSDWTTGEQPRSSERIRSALVGASTPNIDRLASEGLRFTNPHVNIAVCRPISDDVPILQESLTDPDAVVNLVADRLSYASSWPTR